MGSESFMHKWPSVSRFEAINVVATVGDAADGSRDLVSFYFDEAGVVLGWHVLMTEPAELDWDQVCSVSVVKVVGMLCTVGRPEDSRHVFRLFDGDGGLLAELDHRAPLPPGSLACTRFIMGSQCDFSHGQ